LNELIKIDTNLIAIIVSMISLIISWKTMSKTLDWQKTDIIIRQQAEERKRKDEEKKKSAPYIELVNSIYFEFNELFSEYSTQANQFYSKVTHLADCYDNFNGTNDMALRHHMSTACDKILKEISEDILFQHPVYLFDKLNNQYRKLDYILDLKNNKELSDIEYNLKILNENMNPKEKNLYLNKVIKEIVKINDIYKNNQEKIDFTIKRLEKEITKYKN
jgi:hypothetical protein